MGVAIYLSEYASARARGILKPLPEILAGIPTVVYGYFALTFVTPLLRGIFGRDAVDIYNLASAGIVIGVLIVPLISLMTEDALSAVPQVPSPGGLRSGGHETGDGPAHRRAGGGLGHRGGADRRHVARHRRR